MTMPTEASDSLLLDHHVHPKYAHPLSCFSCLTRPLGKHFLNTSESLVVDSLKGLCALNPQLALDVENKSA